MTSHDLFNLYLYRVVNTVSDRFWQEGNGGYRWGKLCGHDLSGQQMEEVQLALQKKNEALEAERNRSQQRLLALQRECL